MAPLRRAGFVLVGKVLPGAVFLYLFVFNLQLMGVELTFAASHEPSLDTLALAVNRVLSTAFAGMLALLYIFRPPAARTLRHPVAVVAALYGSFVLLALRPVASIFEATPPAKPGQLLTLSNIVVAVGIAISVYALLYLKLNFSIVPESRDLILEGPYRLVRHPVYLGEVISAVGLVLALPGKTSLIILVTFLTAQLIRMGYEERLLSQDFPEYAEYAARTKRLIPWLY